MPSTTILEELARPNPDMDNSGTVTGTNTSNSEWPEAPQNWVLWDDFNAETLYKLYQHVVESPWSDPPAHQNATNFDLQIFNEDMLEHNVITKLLLPLVNKALDHARTVLDKPSLWTLHLGRSGGCNFNKINPDWALRSQAHLIYGSTYMPLLVGDTKLFKKWSSRDTDDSQWIWPIKQILHYCNTTGLRYGFIITEMELVVFRCAKETIGPGAAASRSRRTQEPPLPTHRRVASAGSEVSQVSDSFQSLSVAGSEQASSQVEYQPSNTGGELMPVEYRAIPWANHGDGKHQLTVRLGLFYLSLMAGLGSRVMGTDYPAFDSWCYSDNGLYIHNTTGSVTEKRPPQADILQYHDRGASGPQFEEVDGVSYLTRASVRTLDYDTSREQYFYNDGEERIVYITRQEYVFDTETQRWGYFQGLEWTEAELGETGRGEGSSRKRYRLK
ncbi:hypothetical protein RB596_000201 [Gaeumannomyces avenae]